MSVSDAGAPTSPAAETSVPFLRLTDVVKHFTVRQGLLAATHTVHAVDGVTLDIFEGETLGVVGESGCGKSTLARLIVGLLHPNSGTVALGGTNIHAGDAAAALARRKLQMVFQDPAGSLNPRLSILESVAEPLHALGERRTDTRVLEALDLVGLKPEYARRLPHQLSGGQQQRACIARALISEARVVVHDEAVSALDISLQAQVLNLLRDLQDRLGLTYVFISHDLATVQSISTRIAVMYLGKVVELSPARGFHERPLHPYSVALRSAVPIPHPRVERERVRILLKGDVPSPMAPPSGCRFNTRCPLAQDICRTEEPVLTEHASGQWAACHFAGQFDRTLSAIVDRPEGGAR